MITNLFSVLTRFSFSSCISAVDYRVLDLKPLKPESLLAELARCGKAVDGGEERIIVISRIFLLLEKDKLEKILALLDRLKESGLVSLLIVHHESYLSPEDYMKMEAEMGISPDFETDCRCYSPEEFATALENELDDRLPEVPYGMRYYLNNRVQKELERKNSLVLKCYLASMNVLGKLSTMLKLEGSRRLEDWMETLESRWKTRKERLILEVLSRPEKRKNPVFLLFQALQELPARIYWHLKRPAITLYWSQVSPEDTGGQECFNCGSDLPAWQVEKLDLSTLKNVTFRYAVLACDACRLARETDFSGMYQKMIEFAGNKQEEYYRSLGYRKLEVWEDPDLDKDELEEPDGDTDGQALEKKHVIKVFSR